MPFMLHIAKPAVVANSATSDAVKVSTATSDVQAPIAVVSQEALAKAKFDYTAQEDGELSFKAGEEITVLKEDPSGWWEGRLPNGTVGKCTPVSSTGILLTPPIRPLPCKLCRRYVKDLKELALLTRRLIQKEQISSSIHPVVAPNSGSRLQKLNRITLRRS